MLLRLKAPLPEEIAQKIITSDHNGFAGVQPSHRAACSGQHSLTGVELTSAIPSSDERPSHRSWHPAQGRHLLR